MDWAEVTGGGSGATLAILPLRDVEPRAGHAGLDVVEFSSGSSVHKKPHISHAGNTYLRKALYMSALTAAP